MRPFTQRSIFCQRDDLPLFARSDSKINDQANQKKTHGMEVHLMRLGLVRYNEKEATPAWFLALGFQGYCTTQNPNTSHKRPRRCVLG
jgi:hypothetical protein